MWGPAATKGLEVISNKQGVGDEIRKIILLTRHEIPGSSNTYTPNCALYFSYSFRKESEAALIRHVTEYRGDPAEHGSLVGARPE